MVVWHNQLNVHEFGWTLGVDDGQGGLACCSAWGHKESDTTEWMNWNELSQSHGFSSSHVCMWELDHKENWVLKNWCFWTVVLEKILVIPLDFKVIQPVNPKGNQSWIFILWTETPFYEAETPILWPPEVKNWLFGKDPNARKDWRQEEKGMREDEMVGWHHQLDGLKFEQALDVDDE